MKPREDTGRSRSTHPSAAASLRSPDRGVTCCRPAKREGKGKVYIIGLSRKKQKKRRRQANAGRARQRHTSCRMCEKKKKLPTIPRAKRVFKHKVAVAVAVAGAGAVAGAVAGAGAGAIASTETSPRCGGAAVEQPEFDQQRRFRGGAPCHTFLRSVARGMW